MMARRPPITATALWRWANRRYRREIARGEPFSWPTYRDAAKRFCCNYDAIDSVLGDEVEDPDFQYLGEASWCYDDPRGAFLIDAY